MTTYVFPAASSSGTARPWRLDADHHVPDTLDALDTVSKRCRENVPVTVTVTVFILQYKIY